MKDTVSDGKVIDRLGHALAMDGLAASAREHAEHLLNRLSSPVRVSLMGLPGSGKSELLNLFAGQRVIPKDGHFPTTELAWGQEPRVVLTGPDGAKSQLEIVDPHAIAALEAAFVSIQMPLPILKRVRLLEPVARDAARLKSAVNWAMKRTDIVLWCTQEFGPVERAIWEDVPDALKDHAFLVLTKADVLAATGALTGQISQLAEVVAEEFHSMFAVATLQALKAFSPEGEVDQRLFQASGGGALKAEVLRHADRGRRADFDSAEVFLVRHKIPDEVPKATDAPAQAEADAPTGAPTQIAPAANLPAAPAVVQPKVENVTLFADAVKFLKRRGDGLAQSLAATEPGATTPLVDQCMDAVEHLVDLFSDDDSGCPAADAFLDELTEATDLMVLMQVESGDTPAADAVTLLLQLRRDIETNLAA